VVWEINFLGGGMGGAMRDEFSWFESAMDFI